MLWQILISDREADRPWQKLRRNLLLIVQLIILMALVLALTRPFQHVPSTVSGNLIVLLDGSPSMLAGDVEPDRFSAAKRKVAELISGMGKNDRMTLILVGRSPIVLASATADKTLLSRVLDNAAGSSSPSDWPSAVAMTSGIAQNYHDVQIVVVSDGGLPDGIPPLPVDATYLRVGRSGENLAISALESRQSGTGRQLLAGIRNYGVNNQELLVNIELDGVLFDSRRITTMAGSTNNQLWELPPDAETIEARISGQDEDYLKIDDQAWAVDKTGSDSRILLVSDGNRYLDTAFSVIPGAKLVRIDTESFIRSERSSEFELTVLDNMVLPADLPGGDLLIINPLPDERSDSDSDNQLVIGAPFLATATRRVSDHPINRHVDWGKVNVRQARSVESSWARPLVTADGGPLLLVGERTGRRIVILTFDLRESDLPLQIAFPVLMANITGWLSPGQPFEWPGNRQPGESVRLYPIAGTHEVMVRRPDGEVWKAQTGENGLTYRETHQQGLYEVTFRGDRGDLTAGHFAVNLFEPDESSIEPSWWLNGSQAVTPETGRDYLGQREFWPWLVVMAFIILLLEWWLYQRGAVIPKIPVYRSHLERLKRR